MMLSRLFLPHVGGVERHIDSISKELAERGFDIILITEKHDFGLKPIEKIGPVKILRFNSPKVKYLGLLIIWFQLFRLYYEEIKKADIVHIHDVFIWYLPFRLLFPRKPVYITFHGYESYPIGKVAILQRKIAEKLTRGNICIGDFMKRWYGTKPTIVSYGAVDLSKFRPDNKSKYKYDAIFSSRLDEQTGIDVYLKAVKEIQKTYPGFKFLVLGDGKYRKEAQENAISLGFVEDPSSYFKQSKFAFVSRYLAILEAFAAKKLVFAVYDNPVKRDYLKMAPYKDWIVIEKDYKKLAKKAEFYLNNPKKAKVMVEKAYGWVQDQTWGKMADNYEELWGTRTQIV